MSVFKLPIWVIHEIDKTRRKFLWKRNSSDERGIPLANWDLVCAPKEIGGLEIIDLKSFNEALLAKWCWYWAKPDARLWKSIFISSFEMERLTDMPNCKFFNQTLKTAQVDCEKFMIRVAGDGTRTRLWDNNWEHGLLNTRFPILFEAAVDKNMTVQQAYHQNFENLCVIMGMIHQREVLAQLHQLQNILRNQPPLSGALDEVQWTLTTTKEFSVKSMYRGLKGDAHTASRIHKVWKLKVPPRMKVFAWLTYHEKILTAENLKKRGWNLPIMCVLCRADEESIKHLFSECPFSLTVYTVLTGIFQLPVRNWRNEFDEDCAHKWAVKEHREVKSKEVLLLAMFICWREQCARIFRDQIKEVQELVEEVQEQ